MRVSRGMVVLLLVWMPMLRAAVPFDPFSASFELEARGIVIADVRWDLKRDVDGFSFVAVNESTGIAAMLGGGRVDERSDWTGTPSEARPARYTYTRTGRRARSESVIFDWVAGVAQVQRNAAASQVPIPEGAADSLSYVLLLRQDLIRDKTVLDYPVITGKGLRHYRFRRLGTEQVDSALGPLETVRMMRERDNDDPRQTTLWLAPALGYLPVRIEHHERDGEVLVLRIRSFTPAKR